MSAQLITTLKQDELKMASQDDLPNKYLSNGNISQEQLTNDHRGVTGNNLKNIYTVEDSEDALEEAKHRLANGKSSEYTLTSMQEFYAGTHVLITGGTGFLGKVLIEKLLRSCPEIESIVLIVRPKKGKNRQERLNDMFNDILFDRLRKENPNFGTKVVTMDGDLAMKNLGLSEEDRQTIIDKVSIIIHSAATVRFDERLSLAAAINVRGTHDILTLAKRCRKLKAVTHVSTAFANCEKDVVEEKFYEPPMNYSDMISLASVDDKFSEEMTPKILGKFPNTYTFTKAIAEDTVRRFGEGMPVCVVRPGIVISTYDEPLRGWTDNLYGPTGAIVGCGTGVLRTLHLDKNCKAEMVPVDLTVNCILAATWDTAVRFKENQTSDIPIYHFVSGQQMPLTWGQFMELNRKYGEETPTVRALWYYGFTPQKHRTMHLIYSFFLHFIPALIADIFLTVLGKEKMMLKVYRKIEKFNDCLSFFTTKNWQFKDYSTRNLWKRIDSMDQVLFPFDMSKVSWDYHSQTHIVGLRVYLIKDDMSTLPAAKIKWRRLYFLHQALKIVFYGFIANFIWTIFNFFLSKI